MDIGIPLERAAAERRVALTPAGVDALVRSGHRVFIEQDAGTASHYGNEDYLAAGAQLSYSAEEVFGRADLLAKVGAPTLDEYALLREEGILVCFLTPSLAPADGIRRLLDRRVCALAMEMIEDAAGHAPILRAMSELVGPMSIHIAANLLQSASGGRGVLLGGAPGIPPATVVIVGSGIVGTTAAATALGNGAHVIVLDRDVDRLREVAAVLGHRAVTMVADEYNLSRAVRFADVLVGAVMIRGGRTPHVVTEAMVRKMRTGAIVIDVSIDQGGCIETTRPTSIAEPTYLWEGVVHYAVPNMAANLARTATRALTQASLPYLSAIADRGIRRASMDDLGLCRGVVTAGGHCLQAFVGRRFGIEVQDPFAVLGESEVAR